MKALRAEKLGYCFSVKDAIAHAQKSTQRIGGVYSLGPLIQNQQAADLFIQHLERVVIDAHTQEA